MNLNVFESHGFFENRLYIAANVDVKTIKSSIETSEDDELKGAGCRSYGKIVGKILSFFGLASKLKIGDKSFYINNRSFSELVIRLNRVPSEDKSSLKTTAVKLQELYLSQKKSKEDVKEEVNKELKQIVNQKGTLKGDNLLKLTDHLRKKAKL